MTKHIKIASAYWDASLGEHPRLVENKDHFYSFPPILNDDIIAHLEELSLPLIPCIDGHNVMLDTTASSILNLDRKVCLSPNFVKDLSGRFIYIGYGPEQKAADEWTLNRHVSFPKNCRPVTPNIEGHELIENVFFTRFRTLETSTYYNNPFIFIRDSYPAINLYPYKLRLDTFYQDGWRVPQTEMLYVNPYADIPKAEKHGLSLLAIWEKMSHAGADYKDYYNKLQETGALDKMFLEGCSLIPTFDATNGFYDVNDDFSIIRQRTGRAVEGLHTIVKEITSTEPKNTIVEVVSPGYMTPNHIHPAEVIVSDGKRFSIEHRAKGLADYPDLRLPHTRCSAVWKQTWIPTQPHHFSPPTLWAWEDKTGRFLQKSGPLWDPLHYYYDSLTPLLTAFKNNAMQDQTSLAYVPKHMKKRFYPVVGIKGFDIMHAQEKETKKEKNIKPFTGLVHIQDNLPHADVGYHPLPLHFEYELSPWTTPDLSPKHRVDPPENIHQLNLIPVISPKTPVDVYKKSIIDINEFEMLSLSGMLKEPSEDPLDNYPHLHRYLSEDKDNLIETLCKPFVTIDLEITNILRTEELLELHTVLGMDFYLEAYKMREKASTALSTREHLLENHPDLYIKNEWHCMLPPEAEAD